jgi:hypothetical protein
MAHSQVSLLWDKIKVETPDIPSLVFNPKLPLFGSFTLNFPTLFMTGFGYLSMVSGFYCLGYFGYRSFRRFSTYIRSLFNAKKYLNPESPIASHRFGTSDQPASQTETPKAYALIYGVSNRAGGTFATYLAHKGFNLILIERDMQPLNDLESTIKEKFALNKARPPIIHKVVLNKFDQESLSARLSAVKDLPVKIVVNCKNSKRKNIKQAKKPKAGEEPMGEDDYDQYAAAESLLSKEEVYFTGKENIEGYACLINVFIRQLSVSFDNVAVINIDNYDHKIDTQQGGVKQGQLFF